MVLCQANKLELKDSINTVIPRLPPSSRMRLLFAEIKKNCEFCQSFDVIFRIFVEDYEGEPRIVYILRNVGRTRLFQALPMLAKHNHDRL